MRYHLLLIVGIVMGAQPLRAQEAHHGMAPATQPQAVLLDGLGGISFPIATPNAEAQKFFNQGLVLIYGFNHEEAIRCFQRAAELDPKLAMAHWGIALGLGPNYNIDVDPPREKQAFAEMQKALELSKDGPPPERAYIEALAKRFSGDDTPDLKKLAADYANAMRELSKKYPDDLDAAALFADSLMCLRPWQLYGKDYKPAEGTDEIVATLESVLKRDPDHVGANHLYIHAIEASAHPERGLEAASRLPVQAVAAGHLVHMPSHIYSRVGDWESAITSNEAAVAADEKFFATLPDRKSGPYWMMYYSHNIHFIAYSAAEAGNFAEADAAGKKLVTHVQPMVSMMPMLEAFLTVPEEILVRFGKWDELLKNDPPGDEKAMPISNAVWHFGRGMAYAATGKLDAAMKEREAMATIEKQIPPDAPFAMVNKAHTVLDIGKAALDAKLAASQKKFDEAEAALGRAVQAEDGLNYIEPPDWLIPTRETLANLLLEQGKFAQAEKVFREQLDRTPRCGRSLYGLAQSLRGQQKMHEAELVERQLKAAWKGADTKLTAAAE